MVTPKDGNRISKIDMYLNCAENFAYRSTSSESYGVRREHGWYLPNDD